MPYLAKAADFRTFTSSFVLQLESNSDSHTFLFQTLIYLNFGQKQHFYTIFSVMDGPTDRQMDAPSYRDERMHLKMMSRIKT